MAKGNRIDTKAFSKLSIAEFRNKEVHGPHVVIESSNSITRTISDLWGLRSDSEALILAATSNCASNLLFIRPVNNDNRIHCKHIVA